MRKFNRIKVVLAEKDKTAIWLAEQVGRDKSTVSRWCTNDMQPPLEVLYQIAELFGCRCLCFTSAARKKWGSIM